MAESLGEAVLDLRTSQRTFDQGIDRAEKGATRLNQKFLATEKQLKRIGSSLQSAGVKMSAFVTAPIVGLGALAVKLADVQIQAEAGLAAAISFSGQEATRVLPDLIAFAAELQAITTTGDETSIKMLQVATSMGLTADQSKGAVKEAIGLAKAFGIAETTAIRYTAALAQGDTTMLNRYIPTLRQVEGDADRVAKAHEILAGAFGVAVAEAENGLGPWKQLGNEFGDLLEDLGAIILEGLTPLVAIMRTAIQWLINLDDSTKRWIVTIAGILAAVGPVLVALGTFLTILGSLAGALASGGVIAVGATTLVALLSGPLGIALALAAVVAGITIFLREGGAFENWIAGTNVTLQELVGNVTDLNAAFLKIQPDIKAVNQLADEFRNTNSELFLAIREGVAEGKNYDQVILDLLGRFKEGTAEGDALRAKLAEVGSTTMETAEETATLDTNMGTASTTADGFAGTASVLERAMWALANSAKANVMNFQDLSDVDVDWPKLLPPASAPPLVDTLARAQERWNVSIPNTTKELASLEVLMKSGQVPAKQMADIIARQIAEYDRLGVLTPELEQKLRAMAKETGVATGDFNNFFGELRTGIPAIDGILGKFSGFLGIFSKITGALGGLGSSFGGFFKKIGGLFGGGGGGGGGGGLGDMFGGLLGGIKGLFGGGGAGEQVLNVAAKDATGILSGALSLGGAEGATGLLGGLSGILGSAASFLPIIGPILSIFGGPLFKGLKAIGAKIGGFFKGIFGGVSQLEQGGRQTAASFRTALAAMLGPANEAEIAIATANGGTRVWATTVISLRDSMLALGKSEAEALALSDALWKAEKKGPEAVQAVIDGIQPSLDQVSAAMAATGLTLTELRNKAINESKKLGITVAEAFKAIADGTIETMKVTSTSAAQTATKASTDFAAAQAKILADASLSADAQQKKLVELSNAHNVTMQKMVSDTTSAQNVIANVAVSAAQETERAWVKSASNTAAAWRQTRALTVGASSITDIADIGISSADALRLSHKKAAEATEEAWRKASRRVTGRDNREHGGGGGDDERRRRRRDAALGDGDRPFSFGGGDADRRRREGGGGRGGGQSFTIVLEVDGERMARKVVRLTPEILRKMGLV